MTDHLQPNPNEVTRESRCECAAVLKADCSSVHYLVLEPHKWYCATVQRCAYCSNLEAENERLKQELDQTETALRRELVSRAERIVTLEARLKVAVECLEYCAEEHGSMIARKALAAIKESK